MLLFFAALLLTGALIRFAAVVRGSGALPRLLPSGTTPAATVSVIVPARNEADTLGPALSALTAQAGPHLQVVVVDDRSEDGTGAVAEALVAGRAHSRLVRVETLPEGWLGKNHALWIGARSAPASDYLLFTDADVRFTPGAIAAAVALAEERELDHLAGAPRVVARGPLLAVMITTFAVLFALFTRPWKVADPRSRAAVGIGALNLVRRSSYDRAGGHEQIRLRIDDDLALGQLLKAHGGRAQFCYARDAASVEWYPGVPEMIRGLEKNAFAGVRFRLWFVALATAALLGLFVAPWLLASAPWVAGPERGLFAACAALHVVGAARAASDAGLPRWTGLLFPLGVLLFLVILWRSTLVTLFTGGVRWRGTRYALGELKRAARAPLRP
ncbi:MAG: glycosyltransferase family A protein [Planctomycetota bacterium]|nr:glycosyltransferase family A protein [Planctomycetota bacterium]